MNTIERAMRVMTHLNIGSALGMAAWIFWSGFHVVAGDWRVPRAEQRSPAPAATTPNQANPSECCIRPPQGKPLRPEVLAVVMAHAADRTVA